MDYMSLKTLLLISSVLLSLCGAIRIFNNIWLRPKRLEKRLRQQGIKGSSYKLLFGDKEELKRCATEACAKPISLNHSILQRVFPFYHQVVQAHGKVSMTWFDATPMLIMADAELIRLVLTDKYGEFGKPPMNPLVALLQMGVSTLEGEKWSKRRKLMTPAFHFDKLKSIVPEFLISCSNLVDRWKELVVRGGGSCELDIAPEFEVLASDVIARAAFGSCYEEGKRVFQLQKEQAILVLEAHFSFYFPGLRFIPTRKNKRRYDIDKEIKSVLQGIINRKKLALESGENKVDLLGLLLESNNNNEMTNEDIIEECKLFYFAGQETTANWLTWTLVLLSVHPHWQEKARQEVLEICGKQTPDIDNISRLKLVSMILNEVHRLYPPVSALYRRTQKESNIKGMCIPAGVDIWLPMLFVHYDQTYWGDDAEEFKPERFKEGVSKASKDQMAFYPFGWGPRICLGQSFATIEAKIALVMILQNFWFELSPTYAHAPSISITLYPQHGAQIILHPLRP